MTGESPHWQRLKNKDIPHAGKLLREVENNYVSVCGRFLLCNPSKDYVWALYKKDTELSALIINSRSTLFPVLCGENKMFGIPFLKNFLKKKKLHSVQGLTNEVHVLENALEKQGMVIDDIFDYDLMSVDSLSLKRNSLPVPKGLVLRKPQLTDVDAIAPLQAGYEKEEVLPKGSTFNPASSRINITNIISKGQILAAEMNGKLVGKINVSAVSYTRYLVGGVYVHPDFRGLGIAKRMAEKFIEALVSQDKGVTLFVKKNNIPAKKIYTGLGFKTIGDYRITYY
jgi:ribosomal protein S18 acetylase RimI-like enzyme